MIGKVLVFLKNQLNAYLEVKSGSRPDEATEEMVEFLDGASIDPLTFKPEVVSVLLINIEEENTLRSADPFTAIDSNGVSKKVHPEIRLNLYVLFVARFTKYEAGLDYLSLIIQYFQHNRRFNRHNAPTLDEEIEQLVMELITLPFSEQNEIWNALRSPYLPSVLYKVSMIVFRDEDAMPLPETVEKIIRTSS